MLNSKRLSVVVVLGLVAVAIFMFAGLPISRFGWTSAQAQYFINTPADLCGSEPVYQARYGNVALTLYVDASLKIAAFTIPQQANQKLLVCPGGISSTSLKVYYAGGVFYTPPAAQIVTRGLADSQ